MSLETNPALDTETREAIDIDRTKGDFVFPERHKFDAGSGLTEATVDYICEVKDDPQWVREFRHKALKTFFDKPMPTHWATKDLDNIDFDKIRYYLGMLYENVKRDDDAIREFENVPPYSTYYTEARLRASASMQKRVGRSSALGHSR